MAAYKLLREVERQGTDEGYIWAPEFSCFVRKASKAPAQSGITDVATAEATPAPADISTDEEEEEQPSLGRGTLRKPYKPPKGKGRASASTINSASDRYEPSSKSKRASKVEYAEVMPQPKVRGAPRARGDPATAEGKSKYVESDAEE